MPFGEYQGVAVDPSTNTLVPTTTTKNDWSTRLPSPEEAQALGNVEATQQEQQQIAQDEVAAAKERDLNARLAADQKAQDAINEQEALKKANDDMLAQRRQIMGEIEEASRAKQKASNITTLWEDKPTWQKVLSAIGVGLGQGASIQGGGPNGAMQMYHHAQELDQKRKHDKLEAATEELKAKGASLEHLNKFHEMALKDIEASRLAQDRATTAYIEGLGAAYPKFQQEARAAAAKLAADSAEKLFTNTAAIHEVRKSGGSSTTTPGAGGQRPVDFSTKQAVANANETARSMRELGDLIAKNPKAWKEYQDAFKAEQQSAAWKEGSGKAVASSAQFFGVMPVALDQRIKSPEARKINAALAPLITAKAREMDPIGALNQSAYDNAARSLNIVTAPPAEMRDKAHEYADRNARLAAAYSSPGIPGQAPSTAPVYPAQRPAPAKGGIPPENREAVKWALDHVGDKALAKPYRDALKWAAKNPSDPKSAAAIQRVRQSAGAGQ